MPIARGLSLRLFLEGEEIPVISASVSISINAPATASIQIVPLDEAMDFKPRTMVHLFYLDEQPTTNDDVDYKCLFVGEIVGFNYVQSPQGRGLILQCLDHSSYWDAANAVAIEYGPGGNAFFPHGALTGANTTLIDDIISQPSVKLSHWISEKPLTPGLANITGLTGGIIRVMEAMGGVIPRHKGINDFFTISELTCHILGQISSEEKDDTAKKILNQKVLEEWLSNSLESLGQQVTFRDILKLLMSRIFYDVVPNPVPKWTPAVGASNTVKAGKSVSSVTQQRLNTQLIRPDCWFVSPPRCNVIFPEQYSQLSYDRNFLGEATRVYFQLASFITGNDELFTRKIVVPSIGKEASSLTTYSGEESYRHLMTHERHTGIVFKSEMVPDYMVVNKSKTTEEKTQISGERINWVKRAALFHFFKYRFGARTLNLSGRFNPNLVCGFPSSVILKPFNIDQSRNMGNQNLSDFVQTTADTLGSPNQLVGMIIGLHHSIDQSGATTSVSMSHVRKHKGVDDEFLNVLTSEALDTQKYHIAIPIELSSVLSTNNKQLLKLLVNLTPQSTPVSGSPITQVGVQDKNYTQNSSNSSGVISNTATSASVRTETTTTPDNNIIKETTVSFSDQTTQKMKVPTAPGAKGKNDKGLFNGTIVAVEVVDPSIISTNVGKAFGSIILHEELDVSNETIIPFEDLVRPAWFSNVYSNATIGQQIYNPMIGCGSIVDDLAVNGIGLDTPTVVNVSPSSTSEQFKELIQSLRSKKSKQSIERALNVLAYTYFKIKNSQLDVDNFIRQYTQRPVATKEQLLGSNNLEFSISGTTPTPSSSDGKNYTLGFHSLSVHPQIIDASKTTKLVGLLSDPDTGFKRIDNNGTSAPIDKSLDVRWEKRQQVVLYKIALSSHAFQG